MVNNAVATVMGETIKQSLAQLNALGVPVDRRMVGEAIAKYLAGSQVSFTPDEANRFVDDYIAANAVAPVNDTVSVESQQGFLDSLAASDGAVTTPSGLVFIIEVEGEGVMPRMGDVVSVRYEGRLSDGTVFDSTDEPIEFPVADVVAGFSQGLQMMKPGGRYRIAFPGSLGYGADGIMGVIPGNAALDFTVTLDSVKSPK